MSAVRALAEEFEPQPRLWQVERSTELSTLCAIDLEKRWPGRPDPVLAGASLDVRAGETVHISGRNGVGKTTFLRIVAGLLMPDSGSVSVHGLDPGRERRAYNRLIGYLPAGDRGLYARLQVRHQLEFSARLALLRRREIAPAIERMLELFELGELADRRVDRLSMGQRQRVRLALTFLHEPALVLLDEPTTSLDDNASALLGTAVEQVTARGGGVVWCAPSVDGREPVSFDTRRTLVGGRLQVA